MNELSPEARALIEAGRNDTASVATKAAIKSGVLAQVAAPAGAAVGAKAASLSTGAGFKGLGVVLGLGLVAGALYVSGPSADAPEPSAPETVPVVVSEPAPEPTPAVVPVEAPEAPAVAEATPNPAERELRATAPVHTMRRKARPQPARVEPAPAPEAPATDVLRLAQEARLLKAIRVALRDGDHAKVLTLTARHAEEFPEGALVIERLAARAQALCAQGDREAGLAVRAELAAKAPTAPALARVDDACE